METTPTENPVPTENALPVENSPIVYNSILIPVTLRENGVSAPILTPSEPVASSAPETESTEVKEAKEVQSQPVFLRFCTF